MSIKSNWSCEEIFFLKENWSELTASDIANKLQRTVTAVKVKAKKLHLKGQFASKAFITTSALTELLNVPKNTIDNWVKKGYLNSRKLDNKSKSSVRVFYDEDVINFLEKYPQKWDGSKVSYYFTFDLSSKIIRNKIECDRKNGFKKENPVYTQQEHKRMVSLYLKGKTYEEISRVLNRPAGSIRTRLSDTDIFGTGQYLGKGKGALQKKIKNNQQRLLALLKLRFNSLKFEDFWQKDMCVFWDDIEGCNKRQENCDYCEYFTRIKVQTCHCCWSNFYERVEQKFCKKCRAMKKKNYLKKKKALERV